jgi:two-component system response regulator
LAEVRADQRLQQIPVVVLTASTIHREVLKSEDLHVEDYLIKPVDVQQFLTVVKSLRKFLLADVILPK